MQLRQCCSTGALLLSPMVLPLGLLLHAWQAVSQESCGAPGDLPAPSIFLKPTVAQLGETVQLQCMVVTSSPITRVIFCHDGKELSTRKAVDKKSIYSHEESVSMASVGNYSCRYEVRNSTNHVVRSQHSRTQSLYVQGEEPEGPDTAAGPSNKTTPAAPASSPDPTFLLIVGVSVPCVLLLAALGCLLIRKGVPGFCTKRGQSKQGGSPEDEVQYASVNVARVSKPAYSPDDAATTYATVAPRRNRHH